MESTFCVKNEGFEGLLWIYRAKWTPTLVCWAKALGGVDCNNPTLKEWGLRHVTVLDFSPVSGKTYEVSCNEIVYIPNFLIIRKEKTS